jgi:hypothetical protein
MCLKEILAGGEILPGKNKGITPGSLPGVIYFTKSE